MFIQSALVCGSQVFLTHLVSTFVYTVGLEGIFASGGIALILMAVYLAYSTLGVGEWVNDVIVDNVGREFDRLEKYVSSPSFERDKDVAKRYVSDFLLSASNCLSSLAGILRR